MVGLSMQSSLLAFLEEIFFLFPYMTFADAGVYARRAGGHSQILPTKPFIIFLRVSTCIPGYIDTSLSLIESLIFITSTAEYVDKMNV
jgi:hypothetical protein